MAAYGLHGLWMHKGRGNGASSFGARKVQVHMDLLYCFSEAFMVFLGRGREVWMGMGMLGMGTGMGMGMGCMVLGYDKGRYHEVWYISQHTDFTDHGCFKARGDRSIKLWRWENFRRVWNYYITLHFKNTKVVSFSPRSPNRKHHTRLSVSFLPRTIPYHSPITSTLHPLHHNLSPLHPHKTPSTIPPSRRPTYTSLPKAIAISLLYLLSRFAASGLFIIV